jgi:hypothetical protein
MSFSTGSTLGVTRTAIRRPVNAKVGIGSFDRNAEIFLEVTHQVIVNFVVTRDWLHETFNWVDIDIMPGPMTAQNTSSLFQLPDQFGALHRAISFV